MFRKKMDKYSLEHSCPLLQMLDDGKSIVTKYGTITQLVSLSGFEIYYLSEEKRNFIWSLIKNYFDDVDPIFKVTIYCQRSEQKFDIAQQNSANDLRNEVVNSYNSQFNDGFGTSIFIAISIAVEDKKRRFLNPSFIKDIFGSYEDGKSAIEKARLELSDFVVTTRKILEVFNPKILLGAGALELYRFLLNGFNHSVIQNDPKYIDRILCNSDLEFNDNIKFISDSESCFAALMAIKSYPDKSSYMMFRKILELPVNFILMQVISPLSSEASKNIINKNYEIRSQLPGNFANLTKKQLLNIGEKVEASLTKIFKHSFVIAIYAKSEEELENSLRLIKSESLQNGINVRKIQKLYLNITYWSMFPGCYRILELMRGVNLISENIADFNCWGGDNIGYQKCAFGSEPVSYFKTLSGGNYGFIFHSDEDKDSPGHSLIIGKAGSGKTTLISFLLIQALKFSNMKILSFDSFRGCKVAFSAFANPNCYLEAGGTSQLKLNPFLLEDSLKNRMFLLDWLNILVGGTSDEEKNILGEIIDVVYRLPRCERNLNNIFPLARSHKSNIGSRLKPFVNYGSSYGQYSNFFNYDEDNLDFKYDIAAFDMANIINNKELLPLFASYIFHGFETSIESDASPHICFIDEMASYMASPYFAEYILKAVRQWRKRNGIIVGAVQEAAALTASELGQNLITNCATFILFPSVSAKREDYINILGLNEMEFDWIKNSNQQRKVMVKKNAGISQILDVDLACIGKLIRLFNSSLSNVKQAEELIAKYGSSEWIKHYLN